MFHKIESRDQLTRKDLKMHPYHHALSSVRRYGGAAEDYFPCITGLTRQKPTCLSLPIVPSATTMKAYVRQYTYLAVMSRIRKVHPLLSRRFLYNISWKI